MNCDISVVIPLYNKEREIVRALDSVAAQTLAPREIIVVDDGSTDGGAALAAAYSGTKLVSQPNGGVSSARNNGAAAATGRYVAFLDADDQWKPGYIAEIARLMERYPGCGAYCTAFDVLSGDRLHPTRHPEAEGPLEDFFREAMHGYICQPSATVVDREAMFAAGGFPPGMKIGEDLYFWIMLADRYRICFSPRPLVIYSRTASNRSTGIYTPEHTAHSFEDLLVAGEEGSFRSEYIARCAISKALTLTSKGDSEFGRRTERRFSYTRLYRRGWRKLYILNRIPAPLRPAAHAFYNRMAWILARRGF